MGIALPVSVEFAMYVAVKFMAYAAWCYLGLRWLWQQDSLRASARFGLARLSLGVLFGMAIFIVGAMLHLAPPAHPVAMYVSIYAPVRYLEWIILTSLLRRFASNVRQARLLKTQMWILGGVVVSHLADLPAILNSHQGGKELLPVGRFLC